MSGQPQSKHETMIYDYQTLIDGRECDHGHAKLLAWTEGMTLEASSKPFLF